MIKILGIETSCDETSAAIVADDKTIIAHEIFSQIAYHQPYGGVVPEVAARSHMEYLDAIITRVMRASNLNFSDLDGIAVTAGPGLIGGVIVGVMYAKAIAAAAQKPIIAVNHLEGHALTVRLTNNVEFPFLLMLTSGGHCQILIVYNVGKYKVLGSTKDDAAGECFDKVAKMLDLGYPGGPLIEQRAKFGDKNKFNFPKPLTNRSGCDFSFSGLKTAVKRQIDEMKEKQAVLSENNINDLCASLQHTITLILQNRMINAINICLNETPEINTVVLAGGVAANQYIRNNLTIVAQQYGFEFVAPSINLCMDNAAMISWAGIERYKLGMFDDINFIPRSRWSLV
jgi:N6-L-threonylcarbamoyladenine synthase